MKFFTKKSVLLLSLLGTTILVLTTFLSLSDFCRSSQPCISVFVKYNIWDWANYILITPILLLFSFLTYRLNDVVFEAWKNFIIWALPIVFILTYFATHDSGGGSFFTMDFSIYFLAILYGLFFLTSITIIGVSAFRSRNKS